MNFVRSKQMILNTIVFLVLFFLPFYMEIYHRFFHYTVAVLLMALATYRTCRAEKYERKFCRRWEQAREQGFWPNVAKEGFRTFIFITLIVLYGQYIGNDRTPLEIAAKMPANFWGWLVLLLFGCSMAGGIAAWYENEKRYDRISISATYRRTEI